MYILKEFNYISQIEEQVKSQIKKDKTRIMSKDKLYDLVCKESNKIFTKYELEKLILEKDKLNLQLKAENEESLFNNTWYFAIYGAVLACSLQFFYELFKNSIITRNYIFFIAYIVITIIIVSIVFFILKLQNNKKIIIISASINTIQELIEKTKETTDKQQELNKEQEETIEQEQELNKEQKETVEHEQELSLVHN